MNNNQRANQIAIKQFRKELSSMLDDITDIDIKVLTRAVNEGLKDVKKNTPVGKYSKTHRVINVKVGGGKELNFDMGVNRVGGFMRKSWRSPRAQKTPSGATKELFNSADYSEFVNYGHRLVNAAGETVGWVSGQFMLEKAIRKVDKALEREFKKEVERVNREHNK